MPMEIRPLPGQPGLFRSGLGSTRTRWTSTVSGPMFRAPFGASASYRRGAGLSEAPPIQVTGNAGEHVSQAPIPEGQSPGIELVLYVLTQGPLVSQDELDKAFRMLLGQLGYDVGPSSLAAQQLVFSWVKVGEGWEARISQGPKDLLDLQEAYKVVYDPPTPKDLVGLPVSIERYALLGRPKDGMLDATKLQTLLAASRVARAAIGKQTGAETDIFLNVVGVPPAGGNWALAGFGVLGAIGAYLIWKDQDEKKKQGLR